MGRQSEAQQAEGGVEGEAAGGVYETAEGGLIGGGVDCWAQEGELERNGKNGRRRVNYENDVNVNQ